MTVTQLVKLLTEEIPTGAKLLVCDGGVYYPAEVTLETATAWLDSDRKTANASLIFTARKG